MDMATTAVNFSTVNVWVALVHAAMEKKKGKAHLYEGSATHAGRGFSGYVLQAKQRLAQRCAVHDMLAEGGQGVDKGDAMLRGKALKPKHVLAKGGYAVVSGAR